MPIKTYIYKNCFRDSVYLMRLSSLIRELEGVEGAEVIVGLSLIHILPGLSVPGVDSIEYFTSLILPKRSLSFFISMLSFEKNSSNCSLFGHNGLM